MKAIYCFVIACLCGLLGMPDATAQKTKGKRKYPEGVFVVTKSDLRSVDITKCRGIFIYPKRGKSAPVKETYRLKGPLVASTFQKLAAMVGNRILNPEMKEVVKSVRKQPDDGKSTFFVDFAFNGKGEIVDGSVRLTGEYKKKFKRDAEAIYKALLDLKIDVPALKKQIPNFQDFSESDVFKSVVCFDISGPFVETFVYCYADLEETDNK